MFFSEVKWPFGRPYVHNIAEAERNDDTLPVVNHSRLILEKENIFFLVWRVPHRFELPYSRDFVSTCEHVVQMVGAVLLYQCNGIVPW